MKTKSIQKSYIKNKEKGFTLLEYCAGAAVIAGVVWVAVSTLGENLSDLLVAIGEWASSRATDIRG